MVDDTQFLHGRIDPGLESSVDLVEAVDVTDKSGARSQQCIWNDSHDDSPQPSNFISCGTLQPIMLRWYSSYSATWHRFV